MANPRFTPEIFGKTMIINFNVTRQGLEEQLLNFVVGHERPDLQKQREELIQTMSKNSILLAELEDLLLKELTQATGNIHSSHLSLLKSESILNSSFRLHRVNVFENHILISTLQDAKKKSINIMKQQEESKVTSKELNDVASQYRPAAKRGSVLFFSMSGLAAISRMYKNSSLPVQSNFICLDALCDETFV